MVKKVRLYSGTFDRKIIWEDSAIFLKNNVGKLDCIVTSSPDMSELPNIGNVIEYKNQFMYWAKLCLKATKPSGYTIFCQTDRRHNGILICKHFLICKAAYDLLPTYGYNLLWHKLVLNQEVGTVCMFRPIFSNILCFSQDSKCGKICTDAIYGGKKLFKDVGMGVDISDFLIKWVKDQGITKVVDPFCGRGTLLLSCIKHGLNFTGIEINKDIYKQCKDNVAAYEKRLIK